MRGGGAFEIWGVKVYTGPGHAEIDVLAVIKRVPGGQQLPNYLISV